MRRQNRPAPPSSKPNVALDASVVGAFGATGTGKSAYVKSRLDQLAPGAPVVVFDPKHEYSGAAFVSEAAFFSAVDARRPGRLVLRPPFGAELRARWFDRFCLVALAIARAAGRCVVVVDELHLVTDAGRAPAAWRELIQTGRALGVSVIAASIRPAAIDKDFWTNCTLVRTGRLNYIEDQRALAGVLNVKPAALAELKSGAGRCEFIERDLLSGELRRGVLTF